MGELHRRGGLEPAVDGAHLRREQEAGRWSLQLPNAKRPTAPGLIAHAILQGVWSAEEFSPGAVCVAASVRRQKPWCLVIHHCHRHIGKRRAVQRSRAAERRAFVHDHGMDDVAAVDVDRLDVPHRQCADRRIEWQYRAQQVVA